MCEWGNTKQIFVKIPSDLSSTGKTKWRYMKIDGCISKIVEALQEGGIDMRGSCCGHYKTFGDIHLQDGRVLVIMHDNYYFDDDFKKDLQKLYNKYEKKNRKIEEIK